MYVSSMAVSWTVSCALFASCFAFDIKRETSFPFFHNISISYPSTSSLMGAFLQRPGVVSV